MTSIHEIMQMGVRMPDRERFSQPGLSTEATAHKKVSPRSEFKESAGYNMMFDHARRNLRRHKSVLDI